MLPNTLTIRTKSPSVSAPSLQLFTHPAEVVIRDADSCVKVVECSKALKPRLVRERLGLELANGREGKVELEGTVSDIYYTVRKEIYNLHAVVAA